MPGAWDDDRPRADDGYGFGAPVGADVLEELEHELALAAALDRSRPSLSPDAQASARMRRRLFEAMAEETFGRTEQEQDAIRPSAPVPGPSELTAPLGSPVAEESGPATRPVGPPIPDVEPELPAASVGRAAGEHTVSAESAGPDTRTRRRARHVLPSDHPDNPEQTARGDRDRSRPAGRPGGSTGPSGRRRPSLRRRFGVLVTCLAALAVLAGVATTMSRNAVPGDALYGVKRATEATGGAFTFGDQAEATRQLDLARTRMDEVQRLTQGGSTPDTAAIGQAMDDFDAATSTGSRLMLSGDSGTNGSQLSDLRTWATAQQDRMNGMRSSIPQANEQDAAESTALLDRVLVRTEALRSRTGCADGGTASVDDLGPLPSTEPCGSGGAEATPEQGGGTTGEETTTPGSGERSTTGTTPPDTSTSGNPDGTTTSENGGGLLPPLLGGDPARQQSGESDSSTTTSEEPDPLLPPITLPPLLPGVGPVTIG